MTIFLTITMTAVYTQAINKEPVTIEMRDA